MTLGASTWDEARRIAHASGRPLPSEVLPVSRADARVVVSDIRARTPLPPRDASAMDGWAVAGPGPWEVVADIRAGHEHLGELAPGQAVGIATGAAVPAGTTAVLRSEGGRWDAGGRLVGDVAAGVDVRPAGEEAPEGELLVPAGTLLSPAHLGLAAAGGHDELTVVRRPRAVFLVFGDELLRAGVAREGKVRDSLGAQVPAWLGRMGIDVVGIQWVPDTRAAHAEALAATVGVDIVVTSGGTASGPVDLLRVALADCGGDLIVDSVDVRPGSPMMMGVWRDGRSLIGLPGNPQAAIVALMTLGIPLVAALNGRALAELDTRRLAAPVMSRGTRTRVVPCVEAGGEITPAQHIGSGMLRGLADSDGLAVVSGGHADVGATVRWLPLP